MKKLMEDRIYQVLIVDTAHAEIFAYGNEIKIDGDFVHIHGRERVLVRPGMIEEFCFFGKNPIPCWFYFVDSFSGYVSGAAEDYVFPKSKVKSLIASDIPGFNDLSIAVQIRDYVNSMLSQYQEAILRLERVAASEKGFFAKWKARKLVKKAKKGYECLMEIGVEEMIERVKSRVNLEIARRKLEG